MTRISIPNNWTPRSYQIPFWSYMMNGGKRASLLWSRRSGKDDAALNLIAVAAHQRIGEYWHINPFKDQVRKSVWESINNDGKRRIDQAFPDELRAKTLEQDMMIRFKNGSIYRCLGSDNPDAMVGANVMGFVFSEWALCKPESWIYLSPIAVANGGWAVFMGTPRGINHASRMHERAKELPGWFHETLTILDTKVMTPEQVEAEALAADIPPNQVRSEYYCEILADGEYQLISLESIDASTKREVPDSKLDGGIPTIMGYDFGLSGDLSVRVIRTGRDARTVPLRIIAGKTMEQQAAIICDEIDRYNVDACFIDSTGIGYGLVPLVKARGYHCVGVNFAQKGENSDKYTNKRAEIYDRLREWVEDDSGCLEANSELLRELSNIRYEPGSKQILIESKKEIKRRLGHSTDRSDALALTFAHKVPRRDSRVRGNRTTGAKFAIM